jgi:outer membrane protein OmpA-like peptidoglycan-associated protein
VLKPFVGLPGVVAYLQNDLTSLQTPAVQVPSPAAVDPQATAAALAAEKAASEATLRLAEENAARLKAEDAARIAAADEAARTKAAEEAAIAKAAEAASAKAAEAEAEAKAKRIAEDQKRLADELAVAQKADEDARLADERTAERAAVDAAHKAEADAKAKAIAAPEAAPAAAPPAVITQCASTFSDLFRSETIRFDIGSSEIGERYAGYLDQLADLAKRCDRFALSIDGHSDRSGDDGYNQVLSDERAAVIKSALVARGVAADRLSVSGFGAERPFDPSNNRSAYALNRRIDFGAAERAVPAAAVDVVALVQPRSDLLPPEQCAPEFSRLFLSDTIRFAGSSDVVTDEHADFIDRIASLLQRCERMTLMIDGHTDRKGSAAFNQALSEARANAVRDALLDRDIPAQRLRASGFAGQRPYDPGSTPEAFALNRRVEFGISEHAPTLP